MTPRGRYTNQRHRAKQRGIAFELTFEQWLDIWQKSGRYAQMGVHKGQYVMARHGDTGPYAIGNVSIILAEQNNSDGKIVDLYGQRFGRLLPIVEDGRKGKNALWACVCDCGNVCEISSHNLRRGHTKSCGCLAVENGERAVKQYGHLGREALATKRRRAA